MGAEVRESQLRRLQEMKNSRDQAAAEKCLEDIEKCSSSGEGNLLELAVAAARARCSVGEISLAMEKVFGRHWLRTRWCPELTDQNMEKIQRLRPSLLPFSSFRNLRVVGPESWW